MRRLFFSLLLASCGAAPAPPPRPTPAALTTAPSEPAADASPTVLSAAQRARDAAVAPKAAAFVDAFTNYGAAPLKDGRIVFFSTRDGIPTLYLGDAKAPAAAPKRLVALNERIRAYSVLPDERAVLFLSDVKSDENFSVFRAELDGSGVKELTADAKLHRDVPLVARNKNGLFAYSAHAQQERTVRVFVQTADGAPREIHKDDAGGYLADVAPEGDRVLFMRFVSENEQVLFVVDTKTGKATRAYPADGTVKVSAAAFTADGKGLFVARQDAARPARLVLLDAATLKERAHYDETAIPTGTIAEIEPSPTGDRIAFVVDAGNRTELRLADPKTLGVERTAKTGLGTAAGMRWRKDGAQLAASFSGPDAPREVIAVDPKTGEVTPLRADPRPGLADLPKPSAKIVEIRAFDGLTIPTNVYLPASAGSAKLPALVLVHGGPSGSAPIRFTATIGFFTAMGFAVVEPNIRGSTGFGIDFEKADDREKRGDALKDVESVNAWARAQPWCDGERVAIGGISYGGYMTLLALVRQPKLWRGGIDGSGMSDLRTMEKLEDQTIRAYDETEFGALGKDDALLAEWSPLKDVGSIAAPVFVYQGVHDPVTPQNEADQIVVALRKRQIPVEYMLVENEGHGVTRRENLIQYLARSYRFLAEHMGLR
jgi:dipeptidyl aminopeptidase/acylaminoacyl peptidase